MTENDGETKTERESHDFSRVEEVKKIDLHVHSTASDGVLSPREVLEEAKRKGLDGIAITDHDTMEGYREAKNIAGKQDFILIGGIEVSTDRGHVLVLGIEREPHSMKFEEIVEFAQDNDGLTVGAHPFGRLKASIDSKFLRKLDAVEVLNGRTYRVGNEDAKNFAMEEGIPQVAGSDAHLREELGKVWTEVEGGNVKEILQNIKNGESEARGKNTSTLSLTLNKVKGVLR